MESDYTMSGGQTWTEDRVGDLDGELGLWCATREGPHGVNGPWDPRNYSLALRDSLYGLDKIRSPPGTPEPAQEAFPRQDQQRMTSGPSVCSYAGESSWRLGAV